MRKLVATKEGYVRRLRQMLKKWYSDDNHGGGCPIRTQLKYDRNCGLEEAGVWCRDFIGLPDINYSCPCTLNDNAPALALEALALWDAGKHKWQKEKNHVVLPLLR